MLLGDSDTDYYTGGAAMRASSQLGDNLGEASA
jgi:hypothetical protein